MRLLHTILIKHSWIVVVLFFAILTVQANSHTDAGDDSLNSWSHLGCAAPYIKRKKGGLPKKRK